MTWFLGGHHHHEHPDNHGQYACQTEKGKEHEGKNGQSLPVNKKEIFSRAAVAVTESDLHCACCTDDPNGQLEKKQEITDALEQEEESNRHHLDHASTQPGTRGGHQYEKNFVNESKGQIASEEKKEQEEENTFHSTTHKEQNNSGEKLAQSYRPTKDSENVNAGEKPERQLVRMGLNTAIAIGLHNFPEGLATFVAALNDTRVGCVLAFAIAIHNIPEGLCVALPIYYATGSRVKAFFWALLSGASEFIAALLGWAVLANSFSDSLYAALFGVVAGMMVIISFRELLPTAHLYDRGDTVVTPSFIVGMALIAVSLMLFLL